MTPDPGTSSSWSGGRRAFPYRTRVRILRRDPVCVACGVRPSTIADHVIPVAEGGTDDEENGAGMCVPCHDVKTKQEIARGRARMPKRQRPNTEPHPGIKQ